MIRGIHDAGDSSNQVIVDQEIAQHGSLRDKLYGVRNTCISTDDFQFFSEQI